MSVASSSDFTTEQRPNPSDLKTTIKVKLGSWVVLPCKCTRWNNGGNDPPLWKDNQGREIVTKGPESDAIPYYQRKYFLLNEQKQGKDPEDCSLFMRDVNQKELGVCTCIYRKHKFKSWSLGFDIRKITLMADLDDATTQVTVATTLLMEGEELAFTTSGLRVTEYMTQTESTMTDYDLPDISWTQIKKNENLRTIKKRDARWKAYGFDSSALQISNPWASRNMWFQQVTHSVRTATYGKCPCVVRVPTPNTWRNRD